MKNFAFWVRVFSIFCTYISERVFITISDKPERRFKRNVRYRKTGRTRRRQRREVISLFAACMLLCAALMQTAGTVVGPGQPEAWGVFGSMLLRQDAGGYVLVAVVSFAAAAITALCFRLKNRENQKKGGADKPAPQEQEEKSQ